jgi:hypothetical protein
MSRPETAAAAALTVLTLVTLVVRQIVGLRGEPGSGRWLTVIAVVLTIGFAGAMVLRLGTAL